MQTYPGLIACDHCDQLHQRTALGKGEVARCTVCDSVLYRADRADIDLWLALTCTAAILFVLANAFPVIRITMQGMHNQATLWQAVEALQQGWAAPIAVPAALVIIFVPLLQILLLLWVLLFARGRQRAPGFAVAMRMLHILHPWSMLEVCLLGALVAIVKLHSFLAVIPGIGIWAMALLTLLLIYITNRDTHWLWQLAEVEPA